MDEFNPTEQPSVAIRPDAKAKLEAVALVREMEVIDLLDEIVEAARARLSPKPKAPAAGGRGRGRRGTEQAS